MRYFVLALLLVACDSNTQVQSVGTTSTISKWEYDHAIYSSALFEYTVVTYSDETRWVSCSISDSSKQYSSSVVYPINHPNNAMAVCTLTYDTDAGSAGYWTFTYGAAHAATYHDTGSSANGTVVLLPTGILY